MNKLTRSTIVLATTIAASASVASVVPAHAAVTPHASSAKVTPASIPPPPGGGGWLWGSRLSKVRMAEYMDGSTDYADIGAAATGNGRGNLSNGRCEKIKLHSGFLTDVKVTVSNHRYFSHYGHANGEFRCYFHVEFYWASGVNLVRQANYWEYVAVYNDGHTKHWAG